MLIGGARQMPWYTLQSCTFACHFEQLPYGAVGFFNCSTESARAKNKYACEVHPMQSVCINGLKRTAQAAGFGADNGGSDQLVM
jgi:hypothetical protein